MHCTGAATMALDDLLATLERQCGMSGTSGVLADVPAKPAPTLGGTSGTSGTAENGKGKVQAETFTVWALHFTDREPMEVWFAPAVSHDEALAAYRKAVAAEPIRQQVPPRSCRTCQNLKRPGLSAGYCGGRDDLPPAYGPGHPLRCLPDDGGDSCHQYENGGTYAGITASSKLYPTSREPDKT